MESDREEVYERIPWETLEKKSGDRQWLVYAVAGAVVLGALAYSFVSNQPSAPAPVAAMVTTTAPTPTTTSNMGTSPAVGSPVVVAEADLFAVDPERLLDQATAHAEWFAVEFISVDGSEESRRVLSSLLPEGIPVPEAPDGTQVFVDWARARSVAPTGPTRFQVEVLVRSLLSTDDSGFARQPPHLVTVEIEVDQRGQPVVAMAPVLSTVEVPDRAEVSLTDVPADLAAESQTHGAVIGGVETEEGAAHAVVMVEGPDGVTRPVMVPVR